MANFLTHASGAIWWLNLELMQEEPPLVGEITQVQMLYPGSVVPLAMFLSKFTFGSLAVKVSSIFNFSIKMSGKIKSAAYFALNQAYPQHVPF